MPQHPYYSNSPARNFDRLTTLLSELEAYGLIHEDTREAVDAVLVKLHPYAIEKFVEQEKKYRSSDDYDSDDEEVTDEIISGIRAFELFEYLPNRDKAQFIQDYRNAIARALSSELDDLDEAASDLEGERDLSYYKTHIIVDQDTEMIEKLRSMHRSIWFPQGVKPTLNGIYAISYESHEEPKLRGFAYWDGENWYQSCVLIKECMKQKRIKKNYQDGGYTWQGITETADDDKLYVGGEVKPIPE